MKKNILIAAFFIILACVLVSYRGGSASYGVLYASILIPLMSMIYLLNVYLKFRIYQGVDKKTLLKGSRLQYHFDIANEDIVTYTSIKVEFEDEKAIIDDFDTGKVYSLVPGEKQDYETSIRCKYCGQYEIGIRKAIIKDYLRIFSINYKVDNMIRVKVLPRILELDSLVVAPNDADNKKTMDYIISDAKVPDNQIKLYEPGEPAKRIHFKASARMGKMMSKRYTNEPKAMVSLIVTSKINTEDELLRTKIFDKILEGTLAIANYFYRQKLGVDVYYEKSGMKNLYVYDKATFNGLYEAFKDGELGNRHTLEEMYMGSITKNPWQNYIVAITSEIDDAFIKMCYENRGTNAEFIVVYIGDEDVSKYADVHESIKILKVATDSDIEKVLTGEVVC